LRRLPEKHSPSPHAENGLLPPAFERTASRFTILFGLLLILGGWAGFAFLSYLDHEREVDRVRNENSFAAAALEENARRVVKTADTALLFLKSEYEKTGVVSIGMKQFARMTKTDLQAVQVAISDSRGKLIYSVVPMKNPRSNIDREHFQAHLRRNDAGLYIAKPVKSQVSGAWAFFLSRRIDRPDGSFGGIVSIGIDPFYFGKIYGALGLGEDRSGLVVGTDHIVRVRVSPTEKIVGDDISGYSPVFREAARKPIGHYEVVTLRDKVERMASYRAMPDYPLVAIVSVVKPDVLTDWRNRMLANALTTVLFTLFVAGSCYFLNRAQRLARKSEEEQALLRERLVQSQKMEAIGTLAGGVAHDFNNMLGVIIGRTELAMGQAGTSGPLRENLEEIGKAAERSADVTRQLLAFARKQPVAPRVLDLNESLESVLRMIRRLIGEEIDLSWNPGRNLWKVMIDPTQVDQMMANLATNARDAISGVGRIVIETSNETLDERQCIDHPGSAPGDYVVLSVSDDGCGISREQIGNIFDPFFTTKALGRGTGLGLATIYGIVSQNGGFISVYSEPGQGATFRVHLPRAEEAAGAEQATEARATEPVGGSETILLVEDEPANLSLVKRMLESLGYRVLATESPSDAIRLAGENRGAIDLLVTDVVMPEMDGRKLRDTLEGSHPELRTLFMSGYPVNVIVRRGVLDEGVRFIQKPFSRAGLAAKVRETLDATG
jgi:signal transduction histidine kinase